MKKMFNIKKAFMIALVIFLFVSTGCDEIIIGTNLEKGDKYYKKGDYQKAYEFYMKAAAEYQARLGKTYSNKTDAKNDAMKLVEAYYKSGLTAEKLAKDPEARAMFEKAIKDTYAIKESYYEKIEVPMPAGYYDRWVPGYYKDVYVDGYYKDVVTDGYYKEVYDDATGGYKQVWVSGTTSQVWVDGGYKQVYVDGHYEKVWEPAHIEYKDVYKERDASVTIDSPYIVQAKSKIGTPAVTTVSGSSEVSVNRSPIAVNNDAATKAAYEKMTYAYQNYTKAGTTENGPEFKTYKSAQEEYRKISGQ